MKKIGFFCVFCIFLISGCSGYFNPEQTRNSNDSVNDLMLSGGSGYLSTDNFNEISPFLFRDGDKAWLFFASDRTGHYKIYYSQMNPDETFNTPVLLSDVSSSPTEQLFSPIVFKAEYYDGVNYLTNTYISFIQDYDGKRIKSYQLIQTGSDFKTNSTYTSLTLSPYMTLSHIAIFDKSIYPSFYSCFSSTNWLYSYWDSSTVNWSAEYTNSIGSSQIIQALDGYQYYGPFERSAEVFVFDVINSGKHQLYGGNINNLDGSYHTNFSAISDYASDYNDKDPMIDMKTMKVYFASDRFGKGNYDLYRYNIKTFNTVVPQP